MSNLLLVVSLFLFFIALNEAKSVLPTPVRLASAKLPSKQGSVASYRSVKELEHCLSIRGGEADWRHFFSGSVCAAFSHGVTTPIDVVKTKMQQSPERFEGKGLVGAAQDIIQHEGLPFLFAGLGPTVVGYGLEGAIKFGFYETFKTMFHGLTPFGLINGVLASVLAGAIASIVLIPMEDARIKMVGDKSWSKENVVTAIARLFREQGLLATFSGLGAMLAKQIPYTMGKNVSFDFFKTYLIQLLKFYPFLEEKLGPNQLKWSITVVSAFLTSVVACVLSQPGDMILTASSGGHGHGGHGHGHHDAAPAKKKSFCAACKDIYSKHGLKGFYFGTTARLAHVASIITTQLVAYDIVNSFLGVESKH